MGTITPDFGSPGRNITLIASNLPAHLSSPEFIFNSLSTHSRFPSLSILGSLSSRLTDIQIIPGSVSEVSPGKYRFDIRIASRAVIGQRTVTVNSAGRNYPVGDFYVRSASAVSSISSATPLSTPQSPATTTSSAGGTPLDIAQKIFKAEALIFEAESIIIEELAKAAPERIKDTEWLKAAAQKECCAADLIEALAEKERVIAETVQKPSDNTSNGTPSGPGTGAPPDPGIILNPPFPPTPGVTREEEEDSAPGEKIPVVAPPEYPWVPGEPTYYNDPSKEPCDPCDCDCCEDGDGMVTCGCSVTLSSGEERFQRVDLAILGRSGMNFALGRTYRSRLSYNGPLGHGWDFNYNDSLFLQPNGDAVRMNGSSHVDTWIKNPDGSFTAPKGHFYILIVDNNGDYVLRTPDGFKQIYYPNGRLKQYKDRHGNSMQFIYDQHYNLKQVIDVFGRAIDFIFQTFPNGYGGQIDRLVKIRDFIGREVHYSYDVRGDLVEVRSPVVTGTSTGNDFPQGRIERYTYSHGYAQQELNHNLLTVTSPEEVANGGPPSLSLTYGTDPNDPDTFNRVLTENEGGVNASGVPAGGTATFHYEKINDNVPLGNPGIARLKVLVTRANGNQTEHYINERQEGIMELRLTRGFRQGEPPFYATRSFYDDEGLITRKILPEGNELQWIYDQSGSRLQRKNIIEFRQVVDSNRGGGEDLVTTKTYEPLYNRPASVTGPRGNASNYNPPIGTASKERYTTRSFFDYQEGTGPIPDVLAFNIDMQNIQRGLGDLNDDGNTNQTYGNIVRVEAPSVELLSGSNEAARLNSTTQSIVTQNQWNDSGQITATIDPEGNVTEYHYYPENDPDGDGQDIISRQSGALRGYLRAIIADSRTSPRRTTSALPAKIETVYEKYDRVGNVISIKDSRGVVSTIEVNQLNEPVVFTCGVDVSDAIASGQLLTGEAPLRYQARIFYNYKGLVVKTQVENRDSTTEGVGAFIDRTYTYDILNDEVESSVEVDLNTRIITKKRYDKNELLIKVIEPEGNETKIDYDERNLPFRVTRGYNTPDASTTRIDYDLNGNQQRVFDAEDKDGDGEPESTIYKRDGFDRLTGVTDTLGNRSLQEYDVASNVVRSQVFGHPAGKPNEPNVRLSDRQFKHDELNRVYQVDEVLFLSDGFNTVRRVNLLDENSDGFVTNRIEYDALSRVTFTIEDDEEATKNIYDGVNRVVETIDAIGNSIVTAYDQNSNPLSVTSLEVSPEALVPTEKFSTLYVYDQLNRLARVTDNAGQTSRFAYDSRNNLISRSDGEGDPISDPLRLFPASGQSGQINEHGNTVTNYYDGLDRLILEVHDLRKDGKGSNPLDLTNIHNPKGQVSLQYIYDLNSRITGVVDSNGNRTSFNYDALNRKISEINADGTSHKYSYDRDDNTKQIIDPNGSVITQTFDVLNRLIRRSVLRVTRVGGTTLETYGYDGLSRLTKSEDNNGAPTNAQTCEYVYDSLSRILEERQNGQAISNVFTGGGNRIICTYPGSRVIKCTFDKIDRPKTINDPNGEIIEAYYIGPGMRELKRENGNKTHLSFLDNTGTKDVGYDAVKRIVNMRCFSSSNTTPFLDRNYGYNKADQRTSEKRNDDNGLTDRYTYDSIYRIIDTKYDTNGPAGATIRDTNKCNYTFDGVGNRRQIKKDTQSSGTKDINYLVNEMNEYTSIDGVAQVNDDNGNLLEDGRHLYFYDYKNRLISVFYKENNAPVAQYFYDAGNRRRKKTVFDKSKPGVVENETLFFYDGWQVCEEQTIDYKTLITFVYSPVYIDEIVQFERTKSHHLGEGTFYTHQNARTDVVAITDANGNVVERRLYDDYGIAYDEDKEMVNGSNIGNPYGFQGRRLDTETGLYYFRNRYYDPQSGRFIQRDPVWDVDNTGNQYAFVGNGPISQKDPLGFQQYTKKELTTEKKLMYQFWRLSDEYDLMEKQVQFCDDAIVFYKARKKTLEDETVVPIPSPTNPYINIGKATNAIFEKIEKEQAIDFAEKEIDRIRGERKCDLEVLTIKREKINETLMKMKENRARLERIVKKGRDLARQRVLSAPARCKAVITRVTDQEGDEQEKRKWNKEHRRRFDEKLRKLGDDPEKLKREREQQYRNTPDSLLDQIHVERKTGTKSGNK